MAATPTSTGATFLFTDIQGSTRFWVDHPEQMSQVQALHDALLKKTIEDHGGLVFKTVGDQTCAAFDEPRRALEAAAEAQRALQAQGWVLGSRPLLVRMAIHTGSAEKRGGDYFGAALSRVARLESSANGGQVLVSLATRLAVGDRLPADLTLRDLGSHRLKDLTTPEPVFQLEAPGLASQFGPLRTLASVPNNLPLQSTPLVGRGPQVEEAKGWLASTRLLTLTGPGGTGKTSLALQLAADLLDSFTDGAYFVDLGPLSDASNVAGAIAAALSVVERPNEALTDTLCRHFEALACLVVLDNFEHVVAAADVVARLLERAPGLKVIVTSREPLHLPGEQEFPVPPLGVPVLGGEASAEALLASEAVELFVQRAQAVNPSFQATGASLPAIAALCVRLDGLPLAIELAASRMKLFTPAQLLERLDRSLPLLSSKGHASTQRHRTLRHTIDGSYDLLEESQRVLFTRLGVFVDGFTLEAAESLWGDVYEDLDSLLNKSLLRRNLGQGPEGARLGMLHTIREYAVERLEATGEAARVRNAHAGYFAALAESFHGALYGDTLDGAGENAWMARMTAEHGNLIAALEWSTSAGEREHAFRILGHLLPYYFRQAHPHEVSFWTQRLLSLSQGVDARLVGRVYRVAGFASLYSGDQEAAFQRYAKAEELAHGAGDDEGEGHAIMMSALVMQGRPELLEGIEGRLRQATELFVKIGSRRLTSLAHNNLGEHYRALGQYARALAEYEASIALAPDGNNARLTWVNIGMTRWRTGDTKGAAQAFGRVLEEESQGVPSPFTVSDSLAGLAAVADDPARAAFLIGLSTRIAEKAGYVRETVDQRDVDAILAAIRANHTADTFEAAMHAGASLSLDQAIASALEGPSDHGLK